MRVISGHKKGKKLEWPKVDFIRPTTDKVKESIFNIIQFTTADADFLDLFAGSGAIGLEAASRGAKKAILCDKSKEAMSIIKRNIEKTHLEQNVETYLDDYKKVLENKIKEKLDIIYIDPPYESDCAINSIKIILKKELITKDSIIMIETDRKKEIEESLKEIELEIIDQRKYGRTEILFLKQRQRSN